MLSRFKLISWLKTAQQTRTYFQFSPQNVQPVISQSCWKLLRCLSSSQLHQRQELFPDHFAQFAEWHSGHPLLQRDLPLAQQVKNWLKWHKKVRSAALRQVQPCDFFPRPNGESDVAENSKYAGDVSVFKTSRCEKSASLGDAGAQTFVQFVKEFVHFLFTHTGKVTVKQRRFSFTKKGPGFWVPTEKQPGKRKRRIKPSEINIVGRSTTKTQSYS